MAEHVSFFQAKAKPRQRNAVIRQFEKWEREQSRHAKGFLHSAIVVGRDDPDEIRGVVHFDSARSYYANSRRPAQDQWHRELVALLVRRPVWWDGTLAREARGARRARAK